MGDVQTTGGNNNFVTAHSGEGNLGLASEYQNPKYLRGPEEREDPGERILVRADNGKNKNRP